MSYSTHTDDELRRELAAQPCNVVALIEASERFCNEARSADQLKDSYDEGYQAGRESIEPTGLCEECGSTCDGD